MQSTGQVSIASWIFSVLCVLAEGAEAGPQRGFHQKRCFKPHGRSSETAEYRRLQSTQNGFFARKGEPPRSGSSPLATEPDLGRCGERRATIHHNSDCPSGFTTSSMLPVGVAALFTHLKTFLSARRARIVRRA